MLVATLIALLLLAWPLLFLGGNKTGAASDTSASPPPTDAGDAGDATAARQSSGSLTPFLFLGIGYLFVEIPLLQRLSLVLGHPVYSVSVVLVSLMLWSGIGSLIAGRLRPRLAPFVLMLAAFAIASVLVGARELLVDVARELALPGRIAAVVAFLALPGIAMGMAFPLAVPHLALFMQGVVRYARAHGGWTFIASPMAGRTFFPETLAMSVQSLRAEKARDTSDYQPTSPSHA